MTVKEEKLRSAGEAAASYAGSCSGIYLLTETTRFGDSDQVPINGIIGDWESAESHFPINEFIGLAVLAVSSGDTVAYCLGLGGSYRRLLMLAGCVSPR